MLSAVALNRIKIAPGVLLLLYVFSWLFFSVTTSCADATTLNVGVIKQFPPQYQLDRDGKPTGLAIDIIEALANKTGYQLQYLSYETWEELQQALIDRSIDLIPSVGITESRTNWASFSSPAETFPISLFIRSGTENVHSLQDLYGRPVGVVSFNIGEKIVAKEQGLKVRTFANINDALLSLLSGNIDGLIYPQPTLETIARNAHLETQIKVTGPRLLEVKRGIAVRKGNEALLEQFNAALQEFLKTQQYQDIYREWFGEKASYWTIRRVSLGFSIVFVFTLLTMAMWRYSSVARLNKKLQLAKDTLEKQVAERTKDLSEKERKYRTLINSLSDAVFLHPVLPEGFACFREVNDVAVSRYGYSREEFKAFGPEKIISAEAKKDFSVSKIKKILQEQGQIFFETAHVNKHGETFPVEVNARVIDLENEKHILATARDITERKRIEAEISRFSRVIENSLNEIYIFDVKTLEFVDVNLGARTNLGYTLEELKQMTAIDIKPDMTPEKFALTVAPLLDGRQEQVVFETVHCRKDGSLYPVEVHLQILPEQPPLFVAIILDISNRKEEEERRRELEKQLRQKYKMEAVGVLAGGMAHNFNNNLAIIMGNLELAQFKSNDPEEVKKHLDYSKTALLRSRELIKQILIYSRQEEQKKEAIKASQIVEETMQLLHSTIPKTVELHYQLSPLAENISILADETQIQEALINLCNNAVHAMEEKGAIQISLDAREIKPIDIPAQFQALPGDYLQISVRDNGCGIDQQNIEKIFDPFFTTKEVDQGTGMGLSTVRGIVEQHDGFIKLQSSPSAGSVFELYFPIWHEMQIETPAEDEQLLTGSEAILFVDDDEMLAEMGSIMLTEMGYRVTSMINPIEALEKIEQNPAAFDLVITDQTMPNLTGKEFALKVKEIRADLPVILCTGYSSQISAQDVEQSGICCFCMKPLSMIELSKAVRDCFSKCRD